MPKDIKIICDSDCIHSEDKLCNIQNIILMRFVKREKYSAVVCRDYRGDQK